MKKETVHFGHGSYLINEIIEKKVEPILYFQEIIWTKFPTD